MLVLYVVGLFFILCILLKRNGYYIIALPLAGLVSGIAMEISFYVMNRKWFIPKLFEKRLLKQLLIIAVPLFPNFLFYWIFNSCDKLMITNLIGVGATGIYAVGSKLGHSVIGANSLVIDDVEPYSIYAGTPARKIRKI